MKLLKSDSNNLVNILRFIYYLICCYLLNYNKKVELIKNSNKHINYYGFLKE